MKIVVGEARNDWYVKHSSGIWTLLFDIRPLCLSIISSALASVKLNVPKTQICQLSLIMMTSGFNFNSVISLEKGATLMDYIWIVSWHLTDEYEHSHSIRHLCQIVHKCSTFKAYYMLWVHFVAFNVRYCGLVRPFIE